LLNAIEASNWFNVEENILILRFTSNQRTKSQMEHLLHIKKWDKIYPIDYSSLPINFIKEFFLLKKLKKSDIEFNNIFIGDYRLLNFKIFPINIKHNKIFLLDDGTSTFTVQDFYLKDQKEYSEKYFLEQSKKTIAKLFFGFDIRLHEKIHLFSCYNIIPHPGQEIIINEYLYTKTYLHNKLELKINRDKIYYIGAKYVEANLMQEDIYLDLIEKIKEKFSNQKLIYVPHRGENELKLARIKLLGIDIEYFKNIVEIEFLFRDELPGTICGFTSSVLVNIPKIYPQINVMVFKVDKQLFRASYRSTIQNFYTRFNESEGLKLYDL
jgi:hypothetical protein